MVIFICVAVIEAIIFGITDNDLSLALAAPFIAIGVVVEAVVLVVVRDIIGFVNIGELI